MRFEVEIIALIQRNRASPSCPHKELRKSPLLPIFLIVDVLGLTIMTALQDRTVFQGEDRWAQLGLFLQAGGKTYLTTVRMFFAAAKLARSKADRAVVNVRILLL